MIGGACRTIPPRVRLMNLETAEDMELLLNPGEFTEQVSVDWNRLDVPGLPHKVLQYAGSSNASLRLELAMDRFVASERSGEPNPDIIDFRNFILSLTAPGEQAAGVVGGRPPRVLFVWPAELVTLECVVVGTVEFTYSRFAITGDVLYYTVGLELEEYRETRLTSEVLRWIGSVR